MQGRIVPIGGDQRVTQGLGLCDRRQGAGDEAGDETGATGVEILGTQSRFYPDSEDVMGWTVLQEGLQVVFQRRIPDIVRRYVTS